MRTIKAIHKAVYEPIGDLVTYRAMPTTEVPMNLLDPFIFLNHHGWQKYKPNNNGLPFGPHPHRGFETVTFIMEGDLTHKDSSGANSIIKEGGIQWMTAGSGLIHAEVSSEEFKVKGGPLEILQLWVNLPAKHKMTKPKYTGLQKDEIPSIISDDGKVTTHIVCGNWKNVKAPVTTLTDLHLSWIDFKQRGKIEYAIPADQSIFLYIVKGTLAINNSKTSMHDLIIFNNNGELISMEADTEATILFGHAAPFKEPFIAHGPFVMNTKEEIMAAYDDYSKGKFGDENAF